MYDVCTETQTNLYLYLPITLSDAAQFIRS
jgi:hypothetical protein